MMNKVDGAFFTVRIRIKYMAWRQDKHAAREHTLLWNGAFFTRGV